MAGARRVLVTGAGGFIGRHLVADQLSRGSRVVALDLDLDALQPLEGGALRLVRSDVGDRPTLERALEGVNVVFHLAAAHLSVAASREEFRRVNVQAVRDLVAASTEAGVQRVVHCSTVGVFGKLTALPADEDTPCEPEFDYEVTKYEGEQVLISAFRAHAFPVVILRPGWVYGPGCPRTDKLFRAIERGRFVVAGQGDTLRHSVYIRDALEAFQLASRAPDVPGEVIIVGDSGATTVRSLVDEIALLLGAPKPRSVPTWALYAAGLAAELAFAPLGKEPPLSRRTLRFFSGNTSFRTEKARRLLGFVPTYTIQDGLAETHRIREEGLLWSVPIPAVTGGI